MKVATLPEIDQSAYQTWALLRTNGIDARIYLDDKEVSNVLCVVYADEVEGFIVHQIVAEVIEHVSEDGETETHLIFETDDTGEPLVQRLEGKVRLELY